MIYLSKKGHLYLEIKISGKPRQYEGGWTIGLPGFHKCPEGRTSQDKMGKWLRGPFTEIRSAKEAVYTDLEQEIKGLTERQAFPEKELKVYNKLLFQLKLQVLQLELFDQ